MTAIQFWHDHIGHKISEAPAGSLKPTTSALMAQLKLQCACLIGIKAILPLLYFLRNTPIFRLSFNVL